MRLFSVSVIGVSLRVPPSCSVALAMIIYHSHGIIKVLVKLFHLPIESIIAVIAEVALHSIFLFLIDLRIRALGIIGV